MVSKYHKQIEDAILAWCEQSSKIKKAVRGNKKPLSIVDSHTKSVINYQPDVYAIKKNNKKVIFEVLETELSKQDIIIADVIRSCLVENVDFIVFIFYSNEEKDRNRVLEVLHTIIRGLYTQLDVLPENLPNGGAYTITRDLAEDRQRIIKLLEEYSIAEKW